MSDVDDQTDKPVRDAHGLGPPPRAMSEPMRRYWLTETSNLFGLWAACAVLFSIGHVIVVVASGSWSLPPVLPGLFLALAIWSGVRRADHRRRLARVLADGDVTSAIVRDIRQVEARGVVTTYVTYRVEGTEKDITIASIEQGFAFLQVGLRDEVLYLPAEPGIVVPTFMIA